MWSFDFIVYIPADPFATSFYKKHDLLETQGLFQMLKGN